VSVDSTLKPKYDQAVKDLEAAKSKISALEKNLKGKESEISDLKSRLQVAQAAAVSGTSGGAGDEDPLIEMVEKLMKEMEEMARENEEYLANLEKDLEQSAEKPALAAVEAPKVETPVPKIQVTQETEKAPAPPKPVASPQPTAKPAFKK